MIEVLEPGLLSTIQDLGRTGYQKYGVVVSGAMDIFAHRTANLLVGNPEHAPTLELTLTGPTLRFTQSSLIAVTGGGMLPVIENEVLPLWRPIAVKAGTVLDFRPNVEGYRACLAIAGGFSVPKVMGSASTHLRTALGGFEGRFLQRGDELPVGPPSPASERRLRMLNQLATGELQRQPFVTAPWFANFSILPYHRRSVLHVLHGPEFDHFTQASQKDLFARTFTISAQSDRMGSRLSGPPLLLERKTDMISEAVSKGTIQVPPNGNPIILAADCQTTGGYPRIAHVISADIPLLAQMRPGEQIRFQPVSLEQAHTRLRKLEQDLLQLRLALRFN